MLNQTKKSGDFLEKHGDLWNMTNNVNEIFQQKNIQKLANGYEPNEQTI